MTSSLQTYVWIMCGYTVTHNFNFLSLQATEFMKYCHGTILNLQVP